MPEQIEILLGPAGEITLETKGIKGENCRNISAFMEMALGDRISDTPTPEAYESIEEKADVQIGA